MSDSNKSYRIRTKVGSSNNGSLNINLNLLQDYDLFEILSLKIDTQNLYKYQTSKYGCVVGRVLANGGVGVPNVKISAFIPIEGVDYNNPIYQYLYPYTSTRDRDSNDIRYNLLTDQKIDACHQNIGTFPNKRLVLDDSNILEVYDKYYIHTTTTNGSGDYMLFGVPVGNVIIHSDLDLSDIGFLSQKPRDLFYKGYNVNQFENPNKFKKDTNLDNLTQVLSQDSSVYVFPFWGDETENEGQIKIVRNDIDVNYKFEPTCIFIGSVVSDERSNAISKKCIPHDRLGKMDRLTTGRGTIEMIRKTIDGDIESFSIQGNELIDGNGTWCYQIPMNLDYMTTDEYGNLVPSDNYEKGIPTRTSVRFRISLADYESEGENSHLVKVLVPNIPSMDKLVDSDGNIYKIGVSESGWEKFDYAFGSETSDGYFRDLMWNNVYSVKSFIPRIQKGNRQRNKNFTGFKAVNVNGGNNPIPYNNMRINLTFLFTFQCLIFKSVVMIVKFLNKLIYVFDKFNSASSNNLEGPSLTYVTLDGGLCPNLNGNYIAPGAKNPKRADSSLVINTYNNITGEELIIDGDLKKNMSISGSSGSATPNDKKSSDNKNNSGELKKMIYEDEEGETSEDNLFKILNDESYFIKCVELQFALEYEVIQFDFYNDWLNGVVYIPRWFGEMKKLKNKMSYCGMDVEGNVDRDGDESKIKRYYTQQCALGYDSNYSITSDYGCSGKNKCHKRVGRKQVDVFYTKKRYGLIRAKVDSHGLRAYYLKPYDIFWSNVLNRHTLCNLFSTDIILLGNVNECNKYGIPKVEGYTSSSYIMPPPTAMIVADSQEMSGDMKKNVKTYVGYAMQKAFNSAMNDEGSIWRGVGIKLGGCYSGESRTLEEILSGFKEGKEDDHCVGLDYSGIFPSIGDLKWKQEWDDDIGKYSTAIALEILEVYKEKCYEHIWSNPKYINGTSALLKRPNIGESCSCWSGNNKLETCNNYYKELSGYFKYEKGVEGSTQGVTVRDGLLFLLTAVRNNSFLYKRNYLITKVGNVEDDQLFCFKVFSYLGDYIKKSAYDEWRNDKNPKSNKILYSFTKSLIDNDEKEGGGLVEISGIDWGYNPFVAGRDDDTMSADGQIAGHFLEIGCMFSLSNIKSCVNLQRICEIGSEMSQTHVDSGNYFSTGDTSEMAPSGIITKKEISDRGIRSVFATLNSCGLETEYDEETGFFKYKFIPYQPVSFDGSLSKKVKSSVFKNGNYKELKSDSYIDFRFGLMGNNGFREDRFLLKDVSYYLPQYRNSFYFYFGLKDGSTAIDRLYSDYYATCND